MFIYSKNKQYIAKQQGEEDITVSNFTYRIIADTIHINPDNSKERWYTIKGVNEHHIKLPEISITAQEYEKMSWPAAHWGTNAVVFNKSIFSLHVRERALTKYKIKQRIKYFYIGYIENEKGLPFFVDNGGSITAKGHSTAVRSHLDGKLSNYNLPPPPKDETAIQNCIREVLGLSNLSLNNPAIGLLCHATIVRPLISVFAPITVSHFLLGETGSRKSALAAVIQSFNGPKFSLQTQLPAEWEDTENALEAMSAIIRNSTLVVDDLVPTVETKKPLVNKTNRIFRGSANQQARQRSNTNGSLQQSITPGAFILATGETINLPLANSLLNRIFFFSIAKDDIDLEELTHYQQLGAEGVLAQFSTLLISYLLTGYEQLKTTVPKGIEIYRGKAREELDDSIHQRVHENVASVMMSLRVLYKFAKHNRVINEDEFEAMEQASWKLLLRLAAKQNKIPKETTLRSLLVKYLKKGMSDGIIHLADYSSNDVPDIKRPRKLGWVDDEPLGLCVGWYDSNTNGVYIKSSHDVFSALLKLIPTGFKHHAPQEPKKFWKTIRDLGGLSSIEDGGNRVRKTNPESKRSTTVYSIVCRLT